MPFGKKINSETKEQYALVLNPVRGELVKSRMIERMVRVFPLAIDEASDLVENTPIVLLEGLELETGEQVRGYFSETGADLVLTNDNGFKRRCFRAIWPSPPKFDFLVSESGPAEPILEKTFDTQVGSYAGGAPESKTSEPINSPIFKSVFDEPVSLNSKSPSGTFDSIERAPSIFENAGSAGLEKDNVFSENPPAGESGENWHKDRLEQMERDTNRAIQDERISFLLQEKDKLQNIIVRLQRENDELKTEQTKAIQLQKALEEARQINAKLEAERDSFETRFEQNKTVSHEERIKLEAQISELKGIMQTQRFDLDKSAEKFRLTQETDKKYETEIKKLQSETQSARIQSEEMKRMLGELQRSSIDQRKEFEMSRINLEERVREKVAEIESWRRKSEEWSALHANLVRELEGFKQKYTDEIENIATRNGELQAQLEAAQRQIREFSSIAEQQDLVNKRNRVAVQLQDKETKLKELAQRHEFLEREFSERQQTLQSLALERDALEKELAKDRQAQKYLLEQLKLKDKNRVTIQDRFGKMRERVPGDEGEKKVPINEK